MLKVMGGVMMGVCGRVRGGGGVGVFGVNFDLELEVWVAGFICMYMGSICS